jgi:hypothetical protein
MLQIQIKRATQAPPEAVLDTLRERSPERRHQYWSNVKPRYFELHDSGPDFIEVTEGSFIAGHFWERSRYEWSQPGRVIGTVLESNVFRPGSTWELRATPRADGGSDLEMIIKRRYQPGPKGMFARTANHLGGHRLFNWYLGTVLKEVERQQGRQDGDRGEARTPSSAQP